MDKHEVATLSEERAKKLKDLQYRVATFAKLTDAQRTELEDLRKQVRRLSNDDLLSLFVVKKQQLLFVAFATMYASLTMPSERVEIVREELHGRFDGLLNKIDPENFKGKLPSWMSLISTDSIKRLSPFKKK